jgi:hypothetical protein
MEMVGPISRSDQYEDKAVNYITCWYRELASPQGPDYEYLVNHRLTSSRQATLAYCNLAGYSHSEIGVTDRQTNVNGQEPHCSLSSRLHLLGPMIVRTMLLSTTIQTIQEGRKSNVSFDLFLAGSIGLGKPDIAKELIHLFQSPALRFRDLVTRESAWGSNRQIEPATLTKKTTNRTPTVVTAPKKICENVSRGRPAACSMGK